MEHSVNEYYESDATPITFEDISDCMSLEDSQADILQMVRQHSNLEFIKSLSMKGGEPIPTDERGIEACLDI